MQFITLSLHFFLYDIIVIPCLFTVSWFNIYLIQNKSRLKQISLLNRKWLLTCDLPVNNCRLLIATLIDNLKRDGVYRNILWGNALCHVCNIVKVEDEEQCFCCTLLLTVHCGKIFKLMRFVSHYRSLYTVSDIYKKSIFLCQNILNSRNGNVLKFMLVISS